MNRSFRDEIYLLVSKIPKGRVVTYGDIALLAGHPGAARVVGQVAHFGPSALPWHRVVKSNGYLAKGFVPGGVDEQARLLALEGIQIKNFKIDNIDTIRWKISEN